MSDNKKQGVDSKFSVQNIFVLVVIVLLIIAMGTFYPEVYAGIGNFFGDLGKEKVKNADGTISIPAEAQTAENSGRNNTYVGRVDNELIQLGREDEFNMQVQRVFASPQLDPYTKYQYTRYFFDRALNKIIGMKIAKKMNISVSKSYLTNEIGKRYFADADGDPDFEAMKDDTSAVNKYTKTVQLDVLYQNYEMDFFGNMPVSDKELTDLYKLDEKKVSLKYIMLSSNDVSDSKLQSYFNENKDAYNKTKLKRLVFKDKATAESKLAELVATPEKFTEIGTALQNEDKLVNITDDSEFMFAEDYENADLQDAVRKTAKGAVADKVIQTGNGPVIIMVNDTKAADYNDNATKTKVKNAYIASHLSDVEADVLAKANDIYNAAKAKDLDAAGKQFNMAVETMQNPVSFMEYGIPSIGTDSTDDKGYIVSVFKAKKGDVLPAYKTGSGYLIAQVNEVTEADTDKLSTQYNDIYTKYAQQKSAEIEQDFYTKEKKKYHVVDNFNYVFKIQDFIRGGDNQ